MKRIVAILLIVAAAAAVLVTSAAGGDEGEYEVRAIFDSAGFLVTGEDVRVAGAKVGTVTDIDVSQADEVVHEDGTREGGKAVVVMRIDDPTFQDFRTDASCLIRPQSLIGEKFVECEPTQPRSSGTIAPDPIEPIADGEPGEGQYLLPLERNGKAVDVDLVNNIMKEPYPDRFRLILNDLGAGFAARGEELAEIVERANPALRETNEAIAIVTRQNRKLANLARDGDAILSALAREREHVVGFINSATVAGEATAERREEMEESFAKLPGFLRELRSTMVELDRFSTAATPVFADLGEAAPSLTRVNEALGPFASAGTTSFASLGRASEESIDPLNGSDPVLRQIRRLATDAKPATRDVSRFFATFRKTDGFENLLKTIFNVGGAVNVFDSYGHFLRALVPLQNCFDYRSIPQAGCSARFQDIFVPTSTNLRARLADPSDKQRKRDERKRDEAAPRPEAGGDSGSLAPGDSDLSVPDAEGGPRLPDPKDEDSGRMGATRDLLDFLIGEPERERTKR